MIGQWLLAGLLLVAGVGLLVGAQRRSSLHDRLRELDGEPSQDARRWRSTMFGVVGTAAVVLLPVWLWDAGAPWPLLAAVSFLALGVVAAMAVELRVRLRGRGAALVVPMTFGVQRRLAARLVGAVTSFWPVPPLRPAPRPRTEPPSAPASSRSATHLLVVRLPADAPGLRLWDVAEQYLGSRLRYRDLLTLNRYRTTPDGSPITEESVVGNGWTLLVPGDARGPGLVVLPNDRAARATPEVSVPVENGSSSAIAGPPAPDVPEPADTADAADAADTADAADDVPPEPVLAETTPSPAEIDLGELDEFDAAEPARTGPAGYPRAELMWDLVHAHLLADGVLDTLSGLRERRRDARPPGANVPLPDAAAARVEESAHVGADTEGAEFLELALRQFAAGCAERDAPRPSIVTAHLGPDRLELRLATPDRTPPPPFEASQSGSTWILDRAVRLLDAPDVSPRLPGLVSLGPDSFGRLLVNLPAGEVISLTGPTQGCRLVAAAIAVELVSKRWSEAPLVNLVGFGEELAEFSPRLRCIERISQVLDRPMRGDVVILATQPSDAALTALRVGAGSDWFSAPAVLILGDHRRARWHLELAPDGILTCQELDFAIGAQALAASTSAALARLFATERSTELPGVASSRLLVPRPVEPEAVEVQLHLFGRPRLTRGTELVTASDRTVEIVTFLALLGASTPDDLAGALWPHGVDRYTVHAELYDAAVALGESERGEPLIEVGDTVQLAPAVQLDWHLFAAAAAGGADAAALAVAGPTAADDIERGLRHYPWMARSPFVRQLPGYVADVALRHDHHQRELAARHPAGSSDVDAAPAADPGRGGRLILT